MPEGAPAKSSHALDLLVTVIMALAAVVTAWAGFQNAEWGGVQANSYAEAGATRTESSRMTTRASQQRTIDVISFTSWLNALNQEIIASTTPRPVGAYVPGPACAAAQPVPRHGPIALLGAMITIVLLPVEV